MQGRHPKPPGQAITRHRPLHGWLECPDQPNLDAPPLPARRANGRFWPSYALERWQSWSQMPHTRHWSPADWDYARDSLELVVRCTAADSPVSMWAEVRRREAVMGCTMASRMSLRVRYVRPQQDSSGDVASVAQLDEYRDL